MSPMSRSGLATALVIALTLPGVGCYAKRASRMAEKTIEGGSDFDNLGPWVLVTAPGSELVAASEAALAEAKTKGPGTIFGVQEGTA